MALTRLLQAELCSFAHAVTGDLFATFTDPSNRGMAFSWGGFINHMAPDMCVAQLGISFHKIPKKHEKAAEKYVRMVASGFAKRLVWSAGFKEE